MDNPETKEIPRCQVKTNHPCSVAITFAGIFDWLVFSNTCTLYESDSLGGDTRRFIASRA